MQDLTEKTVLKVGTVRVTNLRAIFGTKSYDLTNITSSSLQVEEPNLFVPIFFAIVLGISAVLVALSDMEEFGFWLQVGLYIVIAGIVFFLLSRKTKYRVQISNPVSKLIVLETFDGDYAERVVRTLNEVIANFDA
jgi:hypothetical protein